MYAPSTQFLREIMKKYQRGIEAKKAEEQKKIEISNQNSLKKTENGC